MIISRDDTSSSITFFNSAQVDTMTYSPPFLVVCNSLAICSFSAIKKWTLELVALGYALVASANVVGFLCTSDMITHSSKYAGDMWTSEVDTLHDCTTLLWLVKWYVVHILFRIVSTNLSISLVAQDSLCFRIWWSQWVNLLVARHEVDVLL